MFHVIFFLNIFHSLSFHIWWMYFYFSRDFFHYILFIFMQFLYTINLFSPCLFLRF